MSKTSVKKVGKYEIGRTLGEGTFGKVKFARHVETGEKFAIKILDKEKIQKHNMGEQIRKEISVMKIIKQAHVISLIEVLASRTKIFIVLELVTGGELFDKIVSEGRLNEKTARKYFQQLISGVEYCHAQGICHRDLKPENLLLDQNWNLKISDFGLSALYGSEDAKSMLHTTCGTPNYVAPEVIGGNPKGYDGTSADMWSCGVILFVLLAGYLPFDEPSMSTLFSKIMNADFAFPKWFSNDVKDLISRLLEVNPAKRMKIHELKKNSWFKVDNPYLDMDISKLKISGSDLANAESEDYTPAEIEVRTMNAFELIAGGGSFDLTPMFEKDKTVKRSTRFTSQANPKELIEAISGVMDSMDIPKRVHKHKVKGECETPKGPIVLTWEVMAVTPGVCMVDCRRDRGDFFEYYKVYQKMFEKLSKYQCKEKK